MNATRPRCQSSLLSLCLLFGVVVPSAQAVMTNVDIVSSLKGYSPGIVAIHPNDSVMWTWKSAFHSTTSGVPGSPNGLWDSGLHNNPFAFTNTFPNVGTFPYYCSFHLFTGSVVVASAVNQLPSVTITNPPNGATFAEPWTGLIQATASDSDGLVTNVQFFLDSTSLGSNASAPYAVTTGNVPAGSYTLTAVATDNAGATNTSSGVAVSVVTPVSIVISDPQRLPANQFRFTYTANAGLSYVVQRSQNLTDFAGLTTNSAAGSSVTFTDDTAAGDQNFYRVGRLPNP